MLAVYLLVLAGTITEMQGPLLGPSVVRTETLDHVVYEVENREACEVTARLSFGQRLDGTSLWGPDIDIICPPGKRTRLTDFRRANYDRPPNPGYGFSWQLGSPAASHDDSYEYAFPIAPPHDLFGWRSDFRGLTTYDWSVPTGTIVRAARDGRVVKTHDGSKGDSLYTTLGVAAFVKHSDGTIGWYTHLSGLDVKVGAQVSKGQVVGRSGISGFRFLGTPPPGKSYFGFKVTRPRNGGRLQGIAVKFPVDLTVKPSKGE